MPGILFLLGAEKNFSFLPGIGRCGLYRSGYRKLEELLLPHPPSALATYKDHLYLAQREPGEENGRVLIFPYSSTRTQKTKSPLLLNHRGPCALAVQDRVLLILFPEKGLELFSLLNPVDPIPEMILNPEVGQLLDISFFFLGITQTRLGWVCFSSPLKNPLPGRGIFDPQVKPGGFLVRNGPQKLADLLINQEGKNGIDAGF